MKSIGNDIFQFTSPFDLAINNRAIPMHPNSKFRKASSQQNIIFARHYSFGTLAINSKNGPLLSHIPFMLDKNGQTLEAHLVRSNPILKQMDLATDGVIAVTGPDGYISPDWYGIDNQVPTWNYVAIHIRGTIKILPDDKLPAILERLSTQFEQRLTPKPHWTMAKMDDEILARMLKMIVPIAMDIKTIDGTWKLAQNKPEEARMAAANKLAELELDTQKAQKTQLGQLGQLANLMKNPPC